MILITTTTMERTSKIIRISIHAFLQNYHSFTSTASLLVFPVAASILLSQALTPSSSPLIRTVQSRTRALFVAAGFPASSEFFSILSLKFSQTIFSFLFTFPFSLTFLVLAKAYVFRIVSQFPQRGITPPPPLPSLLRLYRPLLLTHLCNAFVVLSANTAVFSLLFIAFNVVDGLGLTSQNSIVCLSAVGVIIYSVVLANTLVVCNLAVVVSGMENCGGYLPILKAGMLIRGRATTALSLTLSSSLCMAAVEALFQYRVMKPYRMANRCISSVMWEAFSVAYIYSLLVVLDIITSCMFFKSCKLGCRSNSEMACNYPTEFLGSEEYNGGFAKLKSRELP